MQTETLRCLHCCDGDAAHPMPAQLCDECYSVAAGSIDSSEAERLADEGVYSDALTAFAALVGTRIDAMLCGELHLDGDVVDYAGYPMLDGGAL